MTFLILLIFFPKLVLQKTTISLDENVVLQTLHRSSCSPRCGGCHGQSGRYQCPAELRVGPKWLEWCRPCP
ncbi:hypothetical protein BGW80DRAFT_1319280 [Lactifluus volemus]|nr:hypothetical protein BGW80DRAFT_1319280 [Lactifluus volemus]